MFINSSKRTSETCDFVNFCITPIELSKCKKQSKQQSMIRHTFLSFNQYTYSLDTVQPFSFFTRLPMNMYTHSFLASCIYMPKIRTVTCCKQNYEWFIENQRVQEAFNSSLVFWPIKFCVGGYFLIVHLCIMIVIAIKVVLLHIHTMPRVDTSLQI